MGNTVVIGLDGADWSLLDQYVQDGTCPNIAQVMESGVYGGLESIDPPISIPAWLCAVTGKRPDKLDLYNFTRRKPGTYNIHQVFNNPDFQRDAFWTLMDDIGIFNVPSTYPSREYSGFLVAGPLSPGGSFPSDLEQEMESKGFVRDLPKGWQFQASMDVIKTNGDIAAELFQEREPGFFMTVTSVPDRVQHGTGTTETGCESSGGMLTSMSGRL